MMDTLVNGVIQLQPISNKCPIGNGALPPLFGQFGDTKIQEFEQGVFIREGTLSCNDTQAGIDTL